VLVEGAGGPTEQFTSGEALVVRLRLVVDAPVEPPRLSLELRDSGGGLLASSTVDLDEVGWDGSVGEQSLRFTVGRLPLAEGSFQLGVTLTDRAGTKRYHRIDGAAQFSVAPSDSSRGVLRFDGDWSSDGVEVGAG
jgi:hypothetical protein